MVQRKLSKSSSHRKAMFRNMLTEFFRHGEIETTLVKAKELRSKAEKLITTARNNDLNSRRQVAKTIQDKEVIDILFDEIAPRFMDRPGGYTRILKLYPRRGDAAEKALFQLVE